MSEKERKILTVVGGGAAGFFCAVNAARTNEDLKVIIVEKANKLLSKVKVSGGGRCNVTHACFEIEELIKKYPRGKNFLKKSFHWFNTNDTIQWFEEHNVKLKTENDGRMFPVTNNAQTIIDCLLNEAEKYGVQILLNKEIKAITKSTDFFELLIADNSILKTNFLCIACGGFNKSAAFDFIRKLNHAVEEPVPSLFTFNIPNNNITKLMGISVSDAIIKITNTKLNECGAVLITHWGLSGPAVLKLSAWGARELAKLNYTFTAVVNWLPQYNEQALREEWKQLRARYGSQKIANKNPFDLPNRLWLHLLSESEISFELRWADMNSKQQTKLIQNLTGQSFHIKGKTTFKEEFVTCGGVRLKEINPNSMESTIVNNLFFAGEVMDVDGITGGFNFQHAWTSGFIAAKTIASRT